MTADAGIVASVGMSLIGLGVWLVRLEGRINVHADRYDHLRSNHDKLTEDVQYIRARIDQALNGQLLRGEHHHHDEHRP